MVDSDDSEKQGPLKWFWEYSHFKETLGDLIIDRIQGQCSSPLPEIGIQLTPDNIEPWLANVRENRRRYRESESENAAWLDYMATRYGTYRR